jgi:Holliday junction resolvase RusA-like endonuclease
MDELRFVVHGRPAPQGSKSYKGNNRFVEASKYLPAWRSAIVLAAKQEMMNKMDITPFDKPVKVFVTFFIDRPKNPKHPYPAVPPDLDKLVRGLFDSLTQARVWLDDALVCELHAKEIYVGDTSFPNSGAFVAIELL